MLATAMADVMSDDSTRETVPVCVTSISVNCTMATPNAGSCTDVSTKADGSMHPSDLEAYEEHGLPMTENSSEVIVERFEVQEPCDSVPLVTPRWLDVLRQASCYLCLYVAGYKYAIVSTFHLNDH